MNLSRHTIEGMGFRKLEDHEEITATFCRAYAYAIQGATLPADTVCSMTGSVDGEGYSVALAASVNAATRALVDDDWAEDEAAWALEKKCTAPYAVVVSRLAHHSSTRGCFAKDEGEELWTYDAFADARRELQERELRILPPLLASLTCTLGIAATPTQLLFVESTLLGTTAKGRTVRDIRLEMSASGYVSRKLTSEEAQNALADALAMSERLNRKVARFLRLGLEQRDHLKRFLYLFLAIETETHATFGDIDHASQTRRMLGAQSRLQASSERLLDAHRKQWTNLRDRFVWCSLCAWPFISDVDVDGFDRIKKVRDRLTHGEIAVPPADAVAEAERLALLLQRREG